MLRIMHEQQGRISKNRNFICRFAIFIFLVCVCVCVCVCVLLDGEVNIANYTKGGRTEIQKQITKYSKPSTNAGSPNAEFAYTRFSDSTPIHLPRGCDLCIHGLWWPPLSGSVGQYLIRPWDHVHPIW